jgi:hypothetical protein
VSRQQGGAYEDQPDLARQPVGIGCGVPVNHLCPAVAGGGGMSDFWKDYVPEPSKPAPVIRDELTEPLGCVVVRPLVANRATPPAQPAPVQETKKSIVEALEAVAAYFYDGPVRNTSVVAACEKALNDIAGKEIYESWTPKDQAKLEEIEQYRLQMAGISTAAIGYWKEGDGIHPDYDTPALRDVAKLYAKYDALYTAAQRQWVGLTETEVDECYESVMFNPDIEPTRVLVYQAIEAKLKEKNT